MKIIILSTSPYKEKDLIVNAINLEEYITFRIPGGMSPTSKSVHLNNVLTVADVEINIAKSGNKTLKESSVIFSPLSLSNDINYLGSINILVEATNKMLLEEERHLAFPYLEKALHKIKEGNDPLIVTTSYLAKLMKLSGLSLEINRCVRCGSKSNIVTFSLEEGGYLCKNCVDCDLVNPFNKDEMLLIRSICGTTDFEFKNISFKEIEVKNILDKFIKFIDDNIGVNIASSKLIINY